MIGSIYTDFARDSWSNVPGRSVEMVNNENGDPTKITYLDGENIVYVKYLTYDENGNITKIETKTD